jgi:hypothetical protein
MFVSVVSLVPSTACHITTCEHGSICEDRDDDNRGREDSCHALCDRLVVCGNVAGGDYDACMSTCSAEYDRSPASTANGCKCAARASCSEISGRQCPGAPPIGGGYGTTSTTGSGSVTTSATVTGSGAGGGTSSSTSTSGAGGCCSVTTGSTSTTSTTSSTTTGAGGAYGHGGAPSDAGAGTCGD